ncbi:MAG: type II toxin-antitoxin system HicA family toxin [Methanobacteriota archaeon]
MTKLMPVSWKELVKRLKDFGFEGPFSGGRHPYMIKGNLVLTIPNPHKKEISIDLLIRILKQAEIKRLEWLKDQ